jgi:pimeloyl-ACP methyl ester carboxylesterase
LAYPDAAAGGVLLAGGSHPWEGGVAWYNDLAGVPIFGDIFVRTVTYPVGQLVMESAIDNVFDPNPVPKDYKEQSGVGLSLRPRTFSANAEDVRRLSKFLEEQSKRYAEIQRPLLLLTGANDEIVPSWNHADRLENQISQIERIDFANTGHALHHARAEQVAASIGEFVARVVREVN